MGLQQPGWASIHPGERELIQWLLHGTSRLCRSLSCRHHPPAPAGGAGSRMKLLRAAKLSPLKIAQWNFPLKKKKGKTLLLADKGAARRKWEQPHGGGAGDTIPIPAHPHTESGAGHRTVGSARTSQVYPSPSSPSQQRETRDRHRARHAGSCSRITTARGRCGCPEHPPWLCTSRVTPHSLLPHSRTCHPTPEQGSGVRTSLAPRGDGLFPPPIPRGLRGSRSDTTRPHPQASWLPLLIGNARNSQSREDRGRGEPPAPGMAPAHPRNPASPSTATALSSRNEKHPKQPVGMKYPHVQRLELSATKPPAPRLSPWPSPRGRAPRQGLLPNVHTSDGGRTTITITGAEVCSHHARDAGRARTHV